MEVLGKHREDQVELGALDEQGRAKEPGGEMGQHRCQS
jgi:hypothetical protein